MPILTRWEEVSREVYVECRPEFKSEVGGTRPETLVPPTESGPGISRRSGFRGSGEME